MRSIAAQRKSYNEHFRGRAIGRKKLAGEGGFVARGAVIVLHRREVIERGDCVVWRRAARLQKEAIKRVWTAVITGRILNKCAGTSPREAVVATRVRGGRGLAR